MQTPELLIPVHKNVNLLIYPHSKNAKCFFMQDAEANGESRWQLQEGCEYEYEFTDNQGKEIDAFFIEPIQNVIIPRRRPSSGMIKTGIYVGTLKLTLAFGSTQYTVELEIQSVKASYRKDYRKMLTDITEYYTLNPQLSRFKC